MFLNLFLIAVVIGLTLALETCHGLSFGGPTYVSSVSGSDASGDGSYAHPYSSLPYVLANVQIATDIVIIDIITDVNVNLTISHPLRISGSGNSTWNCLGKGSGLALLNVSSTVILSNLTVCNCTGFAVYASGPSTALELDHVTFSDNVRAATIRFGSLMVDAGASVRGVDVHFVQNQRGLYMSDWNTSALFSASRLGTSLKFHGNHIPDGGFSSASGPAIWMNGGSTLLFASPVEVSGNSAYGNGGAITLATHCNISFLSNATFLENHSLAPYAFLGGGALCLDMDSHATFFGESYFVNHSSTIDGGAISLSRMSSSTFFGPVRFDTNRVVNQHGGAISVNLQSSLTFYNNSIFFANMAAIGGAVAVTRSSSVLYGSACRFSRNLASAGGGAMFLSGQSSSSAFFGRVHVERNDGGYSHGGGFECDAGATLLFHASVSFLNNSVAGQLSIGGAISISGACAASFDNTAESDARLLFAANFSPDQGGAIAVSTRGQLSVQNVSAEFRNNIVGAYASAILVSEDSSISIGPGCPNRGGSTMLFIGNSVLFGSGTLFLLSSRSRSVNFYCSMRFADNTALVSGAALAIANPDTDVQVHAPVIFDSNSVIGTVNAVGGALDVFSGRLLFLSNVSFNGNIAQAGGALHVGKGGILEFRGTVIFWQNQADLRGGSILVDGPLGLLIFNHSDLSIRSCQVSTTGLGGALYVAGRVLGVSINGNVSDNQASRGGALYIATGGMVDILAGQSFRVSRNQATSADYFAGGAVAVSSGVLSCTGCIFDSNTVSGAGGAGGAVAVEDEDVPALVTLLNCTFSRNVVATGGSGGAIYSAIQNLVIRGCQFFSNGAFAGGCLFLHSGRTLVEDTQFDSNIAWPTLTDNGGAIALQSGILSVVRSGFSHLSATFGGAIFLSGGRSYFDGCVFVNNSAALTVGRGAGIHLASGHLDVVSCLFESQTALQNVVGGSAIFMNEGNAFINNTSFMRNSAPVGNGTICILAGTLHLDNCTFTDNTALFGAALAWSASSSSNIPTFVTCQRMIFAGNRAIASGGVIATSAHEFNVTDSIFWNNRAEQFGGVAVIDDPSLFLSNSQCPLIKCEGCIFWDNFAVLGGGSVYFNAPVPCNVTCTHCVWENAQETAGYGAFLATPPALLTLSGPSIVSPGLDSWTGSAVLLDAYGQVVTSSSAAVEFAVQSTAMKSPSVRVSLIQGVASTSVTISAFPRTSVQIQVSMLEQLEGQLNVSVVGCTAGSGFDQHSHLCVPCVATSTYSFVSASTDPCHPCPPYSQVVCLPSSVTGLEGYWVHSNPGNGRADVYACNPLHCEQGGCATFRVGPLCGSCEAGYSEWNGVCVPCTESHGVIIFTSLLVVWLYVIVQHVAAAGGRGIFKIAINFLQSLSLVLAPAQLFAGVDLFNLQAVSTGGPETCPYPRNGLGVYFTNFTIPVVMYALLWLSAGIVMSLQKIAWLHIRLRRSAKVSNFVNHKAFLRTTTVLWLSSFQTYLQLAVYFLFCRSVAGESVNVDQTSLSCSSSDYVRAKPLFVLVLLYVIFCPICLGAYLYQSRNKKTVRATAHGVLVTMCGGYKAHAFLWEVVVMVRKMTYVLLYAAFLTDASLNYRRIALSLVALFWLLVHVIVKPYVSKTMNKVDTGAHALLAIVCVIVGSEDHTVRGLLAIRVLVAMCAAVFVLLICRRPLRRKLRQWLNNCSPICRPASRAHRGLSVTSRAETMEVPLNSSHINNGFASPDLAITNINAEDRWSSDSDSPQDFRTGNSAGHELQRPLL